MTLSTINNNPAILKSLNISSAILRCLISGFFTFISTIVLAQQPAYFILGKDQFSGVQIYDIIQDRDLNYLFGTNQGIYRFDYRTFKKVECDEAKSTSVFNFEMDNDGFIYCHNLNNQVFKISGTKCSLFYELKPDESRADITLVVTRDGHMIIGARKLILLNLKGDVVSKTPMNKTPLGPSYTAPNGDIIFHLSTTDSILQYSNGKFIIQQIVFKGESKTTLGILKFFSQNKLSYAFDLKTKSLFQFSNIHNELIRLDNHSLANISEPLRFYDTGNEVWVAGAFQGVSIFKNNMSDSSCSNYYRDYYISNVYKDREGNILLATFDQGVLVIPDLNIPDMINFIPEDPVVSIYSHSTNMLLMGTSKGKLISYYKGVTHIISDRGKHPVEGVYGNQNGNLIIFDNGCIRVFDKNTEKVTDLYSTSLKDAAIISDHEFYLGTSNGVYKVVSVGASSYTLAPVNGIQQRIYFIEYNPVNEYIYTSTADGLLRFDRAGKSEKIRYNGKDIFPNHLHYSKGKIFASTHKHGILIIENGEVTGNILPIVDGQIEDLKKVIVDKNTIIGSSMNGLYRFDLSGKLLSSIHSNNRLKSNRIIDFTLNGSELWVCHSGGVQLINLELFRTGNSKPSIRLDAIKVNDRQIVDFKKNHFKNNERRFQFVFSSPTLKDMDNILYHYRLLGYDSNWKFVTNNQSELTFNALAPGTYTLQLKAENRGEFSDVISYSFTIQKPFYTRWWFITTITILFLIMVYFVYRWQLSRQNKKSKQLNELNASKLTAIQSQMNPHFIFNSLNSIQDLILKGDVENSYSYITTFSNLVRRTLNYSDKDFIDFEQELKLLELYLSLEQLRYKKDLHYTIEVNNVEDIMLPPLLVQPFIENALVHGLLHKEGEKKLIIRFELNESLICTVEDNGIGREQSKAIKQRQRSDHESFSSKAIQDRFEILSNVFKGKFGYVYEDIYVNNQPAGTRVILTIPVKRKF